MPLFFEKTFTGAAFEYYRAFAQRWQWRLQQYRRYGAPPWWTPGVVISGEMRRQYELYLPIKEYLAQLRILAMAILPDRCWLPAALQDQRQAPLTLPDLWRQLPDSLAGQLVPALAKIPRLLTAMADPARFGTSSGRYPQQLQRLQHWAAGTAAGVGANAAPALRVLDLASGTGHGTWELATALATSSGRQVCAIGITTEPLEVWMAQRRLLPHHPQRTRQLRQLATAAAALPLPPQVNFIVGNAMAPPVQGKFELICCNGLLGGSFCQHDAQLRAVVAAVSNLLAADGLFACACRFHYGREQLLLQTQQLARQAGFSVSGDWHDFVASRAKTLVTTAARS